MRTRPVSNTTSNIPAVSSGFFFFQAEDGIRDHCVTGVQTCALPICFAGRYLETGSDSTALAGSLAGGGERSEHPTSVGGKRAGRTDPPGRRRRGGPS